MTLESKRSGGTSSRLAALTALSRPATAANMRSSYSDSEATPSIEAPVFETLVFAKRPLTQRGSTHAAAAPCPPSAPLLPTYVVASSGGQASRLTSANLTTRSVRTPSLCRSETSVGTSASDAASGVPSRCPSGGPPASPVAPNVSLLSAALLSEQLQCTTLRPACGILVKEGAARTASQDRTAHTTFTADSKPCAHARFVEPVKPPRQSRRVSLPQPPVQHRESTSPDYMSEGCPAPLPPPLQKSILAPACAITSSAASASPVPRKRALMFQDVQESAASRAALVNLTSPSAQSSPEVRTGRPCHSTASEASLHPCDVSPRLAASPATLRDSPAGVSLAEKLDSSAYSPQACTWAGETPRSSSLRFCGAVATEAARARTLKFASSPGEAVERRAAAATAAAAGASEALSKLFEPLARRTTITITRAGKAIHPFSSDDEAPYVDAVADEAQRNVSNTPAAAAAQRRVVLVAARSPRRSAERERKRLGRTCGSPAPARLSYAQRVSALRGAKGGGSPAPVGLDAGYEEEDEYDDEEEDDDDDGSEDVDISGSESEEEDNSERDSQEEEEEEEDDEVQAQQEDGSASSCSSTGDIVTGTLMDEEEDDDRPTGSSRPASRLQLTHFLPDTFDSSAPSSPTWATARDGEVSASSSAAAPSRSVTALTLPLARQPRNIPRRISTTSHEASPSGSVSSGADAGRFTSRSPPSPLMTLGRLPMHRSPLGRAQPSTQRSLSSGAAARATPSAAACSMLAAAGHGAASPRSPTSGDDAWHRLRHYLDVGHSDGGESAAATGATSGAKGATGAGVPRYVVNPAQSRARSVPPGQAPNEAAGRIDSAPASPNTQTTGYFGRLHHTFQASNAATDSESEHSRVASTPGRAGTLGARVLFSEEVKRPGSSQGPIRIARPAPNAQSKSDAELSGCAALRRAGLGGAVARRRAAACELVSAGELDEPDAAKQKKQEKTRRRRRTADAELAWGWGKARLGGGAPK